MGAGKSLKNFQKTLKICEFPSQQAAGARKQGRKGPKTLANKDRRRTRWQMAAVDRYKKGPS